MQRRTFLKSLLSVCGITVLPQTTHAQTPTCICEPPDHPSYIKLVKRQTRLARRSDLFPELQAHYAADSRVYSLAWRVNAILVAMGDQPALLFACRDDAWNCAVDNKLFCSGNLVYARQVYKG